MPTVDLTTEIAACWQGKIDGVFGNNILLPGVIVCGVKNAAAIFQLRKQGIVSYPMVIACDDAEKDHYRFLPGLAGILTMAMKSKQLRLPDDEPFII